MRYNISNIVDFKRLVDDNIFDKYIIEVDHTLKLKMQFSLSKVCVAPDLIYFADKEGNYICFDNIKTVNGNDNGVEICRIINNIEQKIIVNCQYN